MSGGEFTDDNPKKLGLEAGSNVTSLCLKQQARAAELLAEQEIATKKVKVTVETAECLQR
jgi:hypothetical protein